MPTPTLPAPALALGAGYLFGAALGSSLPANTVAGGIFTDAWPGAWRVFGATKAGHAFQYAIKTSPVEAAEYYDPLQYETEGREGQVTLELLSLSVTNLKLAFNGGTVVTTGSGATLLTTYTPPDPGNEVRVMLGWESRDGTERCVWPQSFQTGQVQIKRNKGGANNATLPLQFQLELPTTGTLTKLWAEYGAGPGRA